MERCSSRRRPSAANGVHRGISRAAGVDHQQVAWLKEFRQLAELAMHNTVAGCVRNHQPHLVARQPARFGRLAGFQMGRQVEIKRLKDAGFQRVFILANPARAGKDGRSHRLTSSPTSLALYRPLGSTPFNSASRPGTLASGRGRSLISSPGKASCCIWVRISPGSTQ